MLAITLDYSYMYTYPEVYEEDEVSSEGAGAAELGRQGRQMPTQLLVVAIEPCSKSIESSLVALMFQDRFWLLSLEIL